jgi:hypothetical protein
MPVAVQDAFSFSQVIHSILQTPLPMQQTAHPNQRKPKTKEKQRHSKR